ncbi:hypothetical protein LTR37_012310 [Vermiconidia calcicola]|uniref:Uncharacterized protein n=1 Tax=Vermiconidia calcicola TaxID=1690605 RepID=A0ACC3N159_9PEZI|nr:hypothetical protein LTR37_012310 [Vermiconidia calcicola]
MAAEASGGDEREPLVTPTDTLQSETATVANPPASFLGIPRELRNKIYEHVIKDEQFPDIMDRSFRMRPGLVDTFGESKQMSDDCSIHSQNFEAKCANRIEVRRAVQWETTWTTTSFVSNSSTRTGAIFNLCTRWSNSTSIWAPSQPTAETVYPYILNEQDARAGEPRIFGERRNQRFYDCVMRFTELGTGAAEEGWQEDQLWVEFQKWCLHEVKMEMKVLMKIIAKGSPAV